MNAKINILAIVCLIVISRQAQAQIGGLFVNTQYGGVYSAQMNPAFGSQMKHKWVMSLAGLDAKFYNNFASLNMPYHPVRLLFNNYPNEYKTSQNNPIWEWNWLHSDKSNETVNLHGFLKVSGPSALMKYKNHSFGLITELNVFADLKGIPTNLADQFYESFKTGKKLQSSDVDLSPDKLKMHLNIKQQSWTSIGFNYSYLWTFKRRKTLSAGITYKIINARGGAQIQVDADDFMSQTGNTITIQSPSFEIKNMMPRNNKFYPKGYGGIDLGAVFTNKKSETGRSNNSTKKHPDYLYKIGASILDIGNLVYTRTITTEMHTGNEAITLPSLEEIMSWSPEKFSEELKQTVAKFEKFMPETYYGKTIRIGLPTRLVLHGDIQFNKYFYVDAVLQQNLRKQSSKNIHTLSYLMVSPRVEHRNFSAGLPISLDNNYRKLHIGFYARLLWLYMGSRNIAALIAPNGKKEADIFVGIQFGNLPGKFYKGKTPYMFFKKKGCAQF